MGDKQFKVSVLFDATTKKLSEGMRRASASMKRASLSASKLGASLGKKVASGARRARLGMRKFSKGMENSLGSVIPMRLGVAALGVAIINMSMKFNKSMANIATLIPRSTERVLALKSGVQDMAQELGRSTDDLAGGLYQVISAFGDSGESLDQLKINAKAAAAGMATTTDAIALTSAVTKGYGDTSAIAMKKAADLAFMTVKLGQTDFPQLAASIGRVTPFAAKLGISQEELFAGFATLTGVTGGAAEVSTQMAAILKAMLKPTSSMTANVKKLGYESAAAMVKENGMTESLRMLAKQTGGSETEAAKLFGRAEALTAVFALTGKQTDDFDKKLLQMKNSTGALDTAFDEVANGVNKTGHEWEKFKATLMVTAQVVGDIVLPLLSKLMWAVGESVKGLRSLFEAKTYKNIFRYMKTAPVDMYNALSGKNAINKKAQAMKFLEHGKKGKYTKQNLMEGKGTRKMFLQQMQIAGVDSMPGLGLKVREKDGKKVLDYSELKAMMTGLSQSKTDITLRIMKDGNLVVDKWKERQGKSNIKVATGPELGAVTR